MLGISHQGADIDALCIAPCQVTRQSFFKTFFELIQVSKIVDFPHCVIEWALFRKSDDIKTAGGCCFEE